MLFFTKCEIWQMPLSSDSISMTDFNQFDWKNLKKTEMLVNS
jgi:hypothetical protein